jgi:uncharacterized protein (TIGR03437 family)
MAVVQIAPPRVLENEMWHRTIWILLAFLSICAFDLPLTSADFSVQPIASPFQAAVRDPSGNVYIAGSVNSADVETTPGAFQRKYAGGTCGNSKAGAPIPCTDVYVRKIAPDGTLLFATLLGGSSQDQPAAVAVDARGYVYVAGYTYSRDFPTTPNAAGRVFGGSAPPLLNPSGGYLPGGDAFVAKLNPNGTELVYSTYVGGSGDDFTVNLVVTASGEALISGTTDSTDFPVTPSAFQAALNVPFYGTFICKLDADGTTFGYASYFPAQISALAIDSEGNAYAVGSTNSPRFPTTPNAFDTTLRGDYDAFVSKLNPQGSALVYSTLLGGTLLESANAIAVDAAGNVYVAGSTTSPDFPTTPGAFQSSIGAPGTGLYQQAGNAFLAKLTSTGSDLVFSTYFGGNFGDRATAMVLDPSGGVYIAGSTASTNFPTTRDAFQRGFCGDRLLNTSQNFLARFTASGQLRSATYSNSVVPIRNLTTDGANVFYFSGSNSQDSRVSLFRIDSSAPPPQRYFACVVNAASLAADYRGTIAPGEIITLWGAGMGPDPGVSAQLDSNGRVPTTLAGTRVLFGDRPAHLLYVSASQINAVVPYGIYGQNTTTVIIERAGFSSNALTLGVSTSEIEIFALNGSGLGQGAILNQDGTVNSPANPAAHGEVVALFATGMGQTDPPGVDGELAVPPLARPLSNPVVRMGSPENAEVLYAGSAPAQVSGVMQINVRIPPSAPSGNVNITVHMPPPGLDYGGSSSSVTASIAIQ